MPKEKKGALDSMYLLTTMTNIYGMIDTDL